ncbi:MAG: hypothetical protein E3J69_03925 [Anaerolineales bacterium]|nr:MAG: hypothetical protein E3J69_03925 [Anaerolineales bacterium]
MRWSEIAGTNLIDGEKVQLETSSRGQPYMAIFQEHEGILFTITYHPTYKGLTNAYFEMLGVELSSRSA